MILILIGGLLLAGVSVTLAARALAMPRARTVETIAQIDDYGYASPQAPQSRQGPLSGALDNLAHGAAPGWRSTSGACARRSCATS